MDKNNRSLIQKSGVGGGSGDRKTPTLVPFQGMGTRLRRSRSKDHSSDHDNLATEMEIANLKRLNLNQPQQQQQQNYTQHPQPPQLNLYHQLNGFHHHLNHDNGNQKGGVGGGPVNFYSSGTLERPRRFLGGSQQQMFPMINQQPQQQFVPLEHHGAFISPVSGQLYGPEMRLTNKNGSSSALYEESRLLAHQYEEPQYLIDNNYRANKRAAAAELYGKFITTGGGSQLQQQGTTPSGRHRSNATGGGGGGGPTTTIIPSSKLFSKTLSSYKQPLYDMNVECGSKSSSNQSSSTATTTLNTANTNRSMLDHQDCMAISNGNGNGSSSSTAGQSSSAIITTTTGTSLGSSGGSSSSCEPPTGNGMDSGNGGSGGGGGDNSNLLPTTTNHHHGHRQHQRQDHHHHKQKRPNDGPNEDDDDDDDDDDVDADVDDDDDEDDEDDERTASLVGEDLLLSSTNGLGGLQMVNGQQQQQQQPQHYSSIMHTYANPFQNCNISSAFAEDTTGPIIPTDLNTMRPSQLLKNSFAGSGPPPASLQSSNSNSDRNLVSYLTNTLLSYLRAEQKQPPNDHDDDHVVGHGQTTHGYNNGVVRRCSWCCCLGGGGGGGGGCQRCSSSSSRLRNVSLLSLIILVFILLIIIIFQTAMNRDNVSNQIDMVHSDNHHRARLPCVVVDDLDQTFPSVPSTSTSNHHSQLSGSQFGLIRTDIVNQNHGTEADIHDGDGGSFMANCQTNGIHFPRDSAQYKQIILIDHQRTSSSPEPATTTMPISLRLHPHQSWPIWFNQLDAMFVNFQFYAPVRTRLALVANKNEPPTLTMHQIFQVISEDTLAAKLAPQSKSKTTRRDSSSSSSSQLASIQFQHLFEPGFWYLVLFNDLDSILPLVVNISIIDNHTIQCSNNCHNHGFCHFGKCQCFPGFIGHDCEDNVCPVFCNGHGQYLQGSCRCESGWKGKECTIHSDECEISDCNGNGVCLEGSCHCSSGFKGEHCDQADCLDPECSGHGVCLDGNCYCKTGYIGHHCNQTDTKLHKFFPNCSQHGVYDFELGHCMCHTHYTGTDCSQLSCSLDCGVHGLCQGGRCSCQDGWSGSNCQYRTCDQRCLEHGKCHNGTCHCQEGWMGKHCTLNGCINSCSKHGRCASSLESDIGIIWRCHCDDGWDGHDCSAPKETNCNDEIDNDNDGLVDCADSECCHHEQCGHQSLMCITSPDPLDILLRKQPLSPTSSFFQKVSFLIEDGSVQSYAQKEVYSPKRAAIIRGQVVSKELNSLIGIRVSVVNDLKFGFTLTRSDGWFDILVNGGGIITLQFQRNPFYPIKKSIFVPWNEITVIPNPIVMYLGPSGGDHGNDHFRFFPINRASFIFNNLFTSSDFGESDWSKWIARGSGGDNGQQSFSNGSSHGQPDVGMAPENNCWKHDYELMKPIIIRHHLHFHHHQSSNIFITPNSEFICDKEDDSSSSSSSSGCIIAETQTIHERIRIGTTKLYVSYQSSQSQGYSSTMDLRLTPATVPETLRLILLRIMIEGQIHEKVFEADPNLQYRFQWNKRNVYKQKIYGFSQAKVYVGYFYHDCSQLLWTSFSAKLRGFEMDISEIGQWNLEIHNRYNPHDGMFQRGDGQYVSFKEDPKLPLVMEPVAGIDGHPRSFTCTNPTECQTDLRSARFFSFVSLAKAPDGSIFVGDSNLIRRITPDGQIYTVYKFRALSNNNQRQNFEYHIAFNSIDQYLYISDPDRFQIVRIQLQENNNNNRQIEASMPEAEIVVGTGEQCFPHDRFNCDDGKPALDVQLIYPKDLAFALDGSMFFIDGNIIRMMDSSGVVKRVVGQFNKRQWKPIACDTSHTSNDIKLKWPTSLAINPIDGSLYFVDNHVLFKLNQNMQVSILSGYPSFCLETNHRSSRTTKTDDNAEADEIDCQSQQFDARSMALCGDELLLASIAFTPSGVLYVADISRKLENRIFALLPDGTFHHVAGIKNKQAVHQQQPCPVEKCIDMAGHNCTCLIEDYGPDGSTEPKIALKTRLHSIVALTTTGDGTVYVADEGKLRLYSLKPYVPQIDDQHEIKILFPNSAEMYVFNKHGQHLRTRSIVTGRTLYTFMYSKENGQGKLTEVMDSSGHKILLIRDKNGALHMIESTSGLNCRINLNKLGLLESFSNGPNITYHFDYYNNGLIKSKDDSVTGKTYFYEYDPNGHLKHFIHPNGALISLKLRNDFDHQKHHHHLVATEWPLLYPAADDDQQQPKPIKRQTNLIINTDDSWIKFFTNHGGHSFEMSSDPIDHSLRLNTTGNLNVHLNGKPSKLSLDMLSIQAQLFPLISRFALSQTSSSSSLANNNGRSEATTNTNGQQQLEMEIDYNLRLKSSFIDSVEKFVKINQQNVSMLKIEYDWNANREIYYNQSQRPMLFLQYDDFGRPIQWIPNNKEHWLAHSVTYDKFGHVDSWQNGHQTQNYQRDRHGRLTELRQANDVQIRFNYPSIDNELVNPGSSLPIMATLKSGHKYGFDLDDVGRVQTIIVPKGSRHNLSISLVLGAYRFAYCPPTTVQDLHMADIKMHVATGSHCYLVYFDERSQPIMSVLPYDNGKIIYNYESKWSSSKDFAKDFHKLNNDEDNVLVDKIFHGKGLVERWYDRKYDRDLRGIWRNGNIEFVVQYKYARSSASLLKHQSYLLTNIHSVSQLSYNYRYDGMQRLRSIQTKLGSINLPSLDYVYDSKGWIESIGSFRYFERSLNETLIGDGIALIVRRYDSTQNRILHNSLTVSDKEVFRANYLYDNNNGYLTQTKTFMHHLGANKVRLQNYTYDTDGQLVEMQGREHWRFVYDANGNLITFLYMGNRADIEYDQADRIRSFGKGQHNSDHPSGGGGGGGDSGKYVTDLRGFVVQRGDEYLAYNNLGQLLQVATANRYEVNYVYDYRGRLVLRRDHQKNVTQYFYGHPSKPYLVTHSFNNADGRVLTLIYDDIDDSLIMVRLNNENFYVVCDQTKSPMLIFDHRGQVIKEIHRSPHGHVLFDSNPGFYLPVDFHGGIPDPLSNLVYFSHTQQIYDTLTGRYLVPKIDQLWNRNLIKAPRLIHLYQFQQNDPINPKRHSSMAYNQAIGDNSLISLTIIQSILFEQTSRLIHQDIIHVPQLNLLQQLKPILDKSRDQILKSSSISSITTLLRNLQKYYTFQPNYFSKLTPNDWTDEQDFRSLITWNQVLFARGIVLSCSMNDDDTDDDTGDIVTVHFSHSMAIDVVLRESLIFLLNGTHLLDTHLVMAGQDHYFLVKDDNIDPTIFATKFKHFQSKLNLTIQEVHISDVEKQTVIEIRIYQPMAIWNIRFGTTVFKERERVLRLGRKYANQQRMALERFNIVRGIHHYNWNEQEKLFLMNGANGNNAGPTIRMDHYHDINQLAEDPSNIVLKR